MKALLLRLEAPLQSWGTQSRFTERDTQLEPSKSGIVGMLCAALGRRRHEPLGQLAELRMAVRVDREGLKLRDYHTVGGGKLPDHVLKRYGVKSYGVSRANNAGTETAISRRDYLSDARFLIALGHDEEPFLLRLAESLRRPVFPLYLGRKSFVPSAPILHDAENPLREGESLPGILESEPWQPAHYESDVPDWKVSGIVRKTKRLRIVHEPAPPDSEPDSNIRHSRRDDPVSFQKDDRRFQERHVVVAFTSEPPGLEEQSAPDEEEEQT